MRYLLFIFLYGCSLTAQEPSKDQKIDNEFQLLLNKVNENNINSSLVQKEASKKEKKIIYKSVNRTIADMESDGMYFPEEIKEKLKEYREEFHCEYSGLPSPKAYEQVNN